MPSWDGVPPDSRPHWHCWGGDPEGLREHTILMPEGREFQVKERASLKNCAKSTLEVSVEQQGAKWLKQCVPRENGVEGQKVTGSAEI